MTERLSPNKKQFEAAIQAAPRFALRIAPLYQTLGWMWGRLGEGKGPGIPSVEALTSRLIDSIKSLEAGDHICSYSGGIFVEIDDADDGQGGPPTLKIAFKIEASVHMGEDDEAYVVPFIYDRNKEVEDHEN